MLIPWTVLTRFWRRQTLQEEVVARIRQNLQGIRRRMAEAAGRVGRDAAAVQLIAVTKYVDSQVARAVAAAGCADLGESRPQELWRKAEALADLPIRWHQIGHLQRNKLARTLPLLALLHAADSPRLLQSLEQAASTLGRPAQVLLEINISGDASKHGLPPNDAAAALAACQDYRHVQVRGLMGMASRGGGVEQAEQDFARLAELRTDLQQQFPEFSLNELSMGMSQDFEVAIEQGATLVRIGSAIYQGTPYQK